LWSEDTIEREYGALEEIHDNWEKFVVSFDEIDFGTSGGIKRVSVMEISKVL
jgi:hypothetical protein